MRKAFVSVFSFLICLLLFFLWQEKLGTLQKESINRDIFVKIDVINNQSFEDDVIRGRHFLQVAMKHNEQATEKYNERKIVRLENSLLNHQSLTHDSPVVMKKIIFYDKLYEIISLYTNNLPNMQYKTSKLNILPNTNKTQSQQEKMRATFLVANGLAPPKNDVALIKVQVNERTHALLKPLIATFTIQTAKFMQYVTNHKIQSTTLLYTFLLSIVLLSLSWYLCSYIKQRNDVDMKMFTVYSLLLIIKIIAIITNDAMHKNSMILTNVSFYLNIPLILFFIGCFMRQLQTELNGREKLERTLFFISNILLLLTFLKENNYVTLTIIVLCCFIGYVAFLYRRLYIHTNRRFTIQLLGIALLTSFISQLFHPAILEAFAIGGVSAFLLMEFIRTMSNVFTHLAEQEKKVAQLTEQLASLEKKRLEQHHTLNEIKEHQYEQHRSRHELLRTITHELNTLLTFIRGYIKAMLDNVVEKSNPAYLRAIYEDTQTMQLLVSELSDFSTYDYGQMAYEREDVPIVLFLRKVIQGRRLLYKHKDIELFYEEEIVDEKAMHLVCHIDPQRIKQVVLNLIKNAQNAIDSRGSITVRLSYKEAASYVAISVIDTGIGIEREHLPYIFERLYRVEDNDEVSGTGLGLAICKEIIESHGGTIQVQSTPNFGSTFTFTLPIKKNKNIIGVN